MNSIIHLGYLWDIVNLGIPGYLIFDENGYPQLSQGFKDDHIFGELGSDPLGSFLFFHAPEDVFSYWKESENFAEFRTKINVPSGPDRGDNMRAWAEIFNYSGLGKWAFHGQPGVYDIKSDKRTDEIEGYFLVLLSLIESDPKLGLELYDQIAQAVGEQNLTNDWILLKPRGNETRLVGYRLDFLIAVVVPEKYADLVASASTVSLL